MVAPKDQQKPTLMDFVSSFHRSRMYRSAVLTRRDPEDNMKQVFLTSARRGDKPSNLEAYLLTATRGSGEVFLAPNEFARCSRRVDALARLTSIYVDLDSVVDRFGALRRLEVMVWGRVLPRPSWIVDSGAGIHLYWLFDKPVGFDQASACRSIMSSFAYRLRDYGADSACVDIVRPLRVPFSRHHSGRMVTIVEGNGQIRYTLKCLSDWASSELVDDAMPTDLTLLASNARVIPMRPRAAKPRVSSDARKAVTSGAKVISFPVRRPAAPVEPQKVRRFYRGPDGQRVTLHFGSRSLAAARLRDIETLTRIRRVCEGSRELMLWVARIQVLKLCECDKISGDTRDQVVEERILSLNRLMSDPLSDHEALQGTRSASRYNQPTNMWLIENLGISPEEQRHLLTIIDLDEVRRRNAEHKRMARRGADGFTIRERQARLTAASVWTLMEQGMPVSQIATTLGLTRQGVYYAAKRSAQLSAQERTAIAQSITTNVIQLRPRTSRSDSATAEVSKLDLPA